MEESNNSAITKLIGQRIRDLRTEKRLSQAYLAQNIGISSPAISKIESGVTDINLSRLEELANVLKVDIISLFTEEMYEVQNKEYNIKILRRKLANREEEISILQRKVILIYDQLFQNKQHHKQVRSKK